MKPIHCKLFCSLYITVTRITVTAFAAYCILCLIFLKLVFRHFSARLVIVSLASFGVRGSGCIFVILSLLLLGDVVRRYVLLCECVRCRDASGAE